jgi:FkbM family methyltransferase
MKQLLVKLARRATEPLLFQKTLPSDFNGEKIIVSSRSDIRLLAPGLERAAGDLFAVVRKYVCPNDVVWDIGSNLGILTFCSAIKTQRGGYVFSLEADPRYADIQSRTLKTFSEEAGKISILCAAVADHQGLLELVIPKKGHARNHLSVVTGNSAGEADMIKQVVTVTLDWLLEYWRPPNFVKIDVEGAELLAVSGGERLFSECRPTGYIECSSENSEALTGFFKSHDYSLFSLDAHGEEKPIEKFAFNTIVKPKERCEQVGAANVSPRRV